MFAHRGTFGGFGLGGSAWCLRKDPLGGQLVTCFRANLLFSVVVAVLLLLALCAFNRYPLHSAYCC